MREDNLEDNPGDQSSLMLENYTTAIQVNMAINLIGSKHPHNWPRIKETIM